MGFYFNCPYCYGDQHRPNVIMDGITECDYCHKQIKLRGDIPEKQTRNTDFKDALDYAYKGYGREGSSISQLRMQALQLLLRNNSDYLNWDNVVNAADLYVHYCLTGEHQLPEKN